MYIDGKINPDTFDRYQVFVENKRLYPAFSLSVYNHSPDGFSWGYMGSGCAQLALALLLLVTNTETAVRLHQDFKTVFVAELNKDEDFHSFINIGFWVKEHGGEITNVNFEKSFTVEGK